MLPSAPTIHPLARAIALLSLGVYLGWLVAGGAVAGWRAIEIAAVLEERRARLDAS